MKDTQSLISILITAGYFLFKIVSAIVGQKTKSIEKPDEVKDWENDFKEEEDSWETIPPTWNYDEWVAEETENVTQYYAKEILVPAANATAVNASYQNIANTSTANSNYYPGIHRLLLPTQEKNPYKLYQLTFPKHTSKLNHVLRNYSSPQRAIIMSELLQRKPWY
jgi:hypothetical protein